MRQNLHSETDWVDFQLKQTHKGNILPKILTGPRASQHSIKNIQDTIQTYSAYKELGKSDSIEGKRPSADASPEMTQMVMGLSDKDLKQSIIAMFNGVMVNIFEMK